MCKITELNPHKDEVVRIKFKSIEQITKCCDMDFHKAEEFYDVGDNIKAYINGGDFIVTSSYKKEEDGKVYIIVKNHYDNDSEFYVYSDVIESIDIVLDAERFYSSDLCLLVIRVEDELYINGRSLIGDEEYKEDMYNRQVKRGKKTGNYNNKNRKLLKLFENYIADLAVRESFKDMGEK